MCVCVAHVCRYYIAVRHVAAYGERLAPQETATLAQGLTTQALTWSTCWSGSEPPPPASAPPQPPTDTQPLLAAAADPQQPAAAAADELLPGSPKLEWEAAAAEGPNSADPQPDNTSTAQQDAPSDAAANAVQAHNTTGRPNSAFDRSGSDGGSSEGEDQDSPAWGPIAELLVPGGHMTEEERHTALINALVG